MHTCLCIDVSVRICFCKSLARRARGEGTELARLRRARSRVQSSPACGGLALPRDCRAWHNRSFHERRKRITQRHIKQIACPCIPCKAADLQPPKTVLAMAFPPRDGLFPLPVEEKALWIQRTSAKSKRNLTFPCACRVKALYPSKVYAY